MRVRLASADFARRCLASLKAARRLLRGVLVVESYSCPVGCFGRSVRLWRLVYAPANRKGSVVDGDTCRDFPLGDTEQPYSLPAAVGDRSAPW